MAAIIGKYNEDATVCLMQSQFETVLKKNCVANKRLAKVPTFGQMPISRQF
jgi:hypothetical protein